MRTKRTGFCSGSKPGSTCRGRRIAPDLEALIKDKAAGLRTRLTACRVLTRLGPVSVPALLVAVEDETQQLRLKAIECLGRVKPTSADVVTRLVALMDNENYEIRKSAFRAITVVGPPAKQHDPQLVEKLTNTLNDLKEDETIRSLAHDALKKIDPRKGLMGAEKGEPARAAADQILQQRLVELHARIERHVVDAGLKALAAVAFAEGVDLGQVVVAVARRRRRRPFRASPGPRTRSSRRRGK